MSQSPPETYSFSYEEKKIIKAFIQFFCRNLQYNQGSIILCLKLNDFLSHHCDYQCVIRNYIRDLVHILGLSVILPDIGRQEISQSKEAVFYLNCSKVMTYLDDFISDFPSDEARAILLHESILELRQEAPRLSETKKFFETYVNQQRLTMGPE